MGVWLGRKRIPPLPFETVLEDRSDGKKYRVTRNGSVPDTLEVTEPIDRNRYRVYAPFTGPSLTDENGVVYRLYVDNGSLGFESF